MFSPALPGLNGLFNIPGVAYASRLLHQNLSAQAQPFSSPLKCPDPNLQRVSSSFVPVPDNPTSETPPSFSLKLILSCVCFFHPSFFPFWWFCVFQMSHVAFLSGSPGGGGSHSHRQRPVNHGPNHRPYGSCTHV